jgi:hypothetical protein
MDGKIVDSQLRIQDRRQSYGVVECSTYGLSTITHWRRITPPVPIIQRVKVDQHEVIPQPDGSLKVGCQTIPSEQFEEIVRQRAAAMEKGQ